ncbi:MAG: hypothetical protein ACT4NY_19420 [Pseudonocardiales bacterium]
MCRTSPVNDGQRRPESGDEDAADIRALSAKVGAVPGADPKTVRLAVCARERVDNVPDDALAITADDIMATAPRDA